MRRTSSALPSPSRATSAGRPGPCGDTANSSTGSPPPSSSSCSSSARPTPAAAFDLDRISALRTELGRRCCDHPHDHAHGCGCDHGRDHRCGDGCGSDHGCGEHGHHGACGHDDEDCDCLCTHLHGDGRAAGGLEDGWSVKSRATVNPSRCPSGTSGGPRSTGPTTRTTSTWCRPLRHNFRSARPRAADAGADGLPLRRRPDPRRPGSGGLRGVSPRAASRAPGPRTARAPRRAMSSWPRATSGSRSPSTGARASRP